jgi:hypothetical protein
MHGNEGMRKFCIDKVFNFILFLLTQMEISKCSFFLIIKKKLFDDGSLHS